MKREMGDAEWTVTYETIAYREKGIAERGGWITEEMEFISYG